MTVTAAMANGHGIAHGAYVFLLADTTFAVACNSHGPRTLAAGCDITYLSPAEVGDELVAEAREVALQRAQRPLRRVRAAVGRQRGGGDARSQPDRRGQSRARRRGQRILRSMTPDPT